MCESKFSNRRDQSRGISPGNHCSTAGAIILRIAYGYRVKEGDDPFVTLVDEAIVQFSQATSPGFVVNLVPARK